MKKLFLIIPLFIITAVLNGCVSSNSETISTDTKSVQTKIENKEISKESNKLYFFPFSTKTDNLIETYDNDQTIFAIGYPSFLANIFSSIDTLDIHDYTFIASTTEDTTTVTGFSNWEIETLINVTSTRSPDLEGYGITGYIEINENDISYIKIIVFEMETGKVLSDTLYDPPFSYILDVLVGYAINDIVYKTKTENHFIGKTMELPVSILQSPMGFIYSIKLRGINTIENKLGEIRSIDEKLDIIYEGFKLHNDFLVLQIMLRDILNDIDDYSPYKSKIDSINDIIVNKTPDYISTYNKTN